jgi:hypothetical protein
MLNVVRKYGDNGRHTSGQRQMCGSVRPQGLLKNQTFKGVNWVTKKYFDEHSKYLLNTKQIALLSVKK